MTEKHSPGPWSAGKPDDGDIFVKDANGSIVCEAGYARPDEKANANARLIAAAPEMLAMLSDLQGVIDDEGWAPCDEAALGQLLSRIDGEDD